MLTLVGETTTRRDFFALGIEVEILFSVGFTRWEKDWNGKPGPAIENKNNP
ncbi:MAG: hypothetical protein H7282_04200 [Cytophagaceae bacterium]|nr:hypothetical protein [Cytophagaceae bacterium]